MVLEPLDAVGVVETGGELPEPPAFENTDVAVVGLLVLPGLAHVHLSAGTDGDGLGLLQPSDDLGLLCREGHGNHDGSKAQPDHSNLLGPVEAVSSLICPLVRPLSSCGL